MHIVLKRAIRSAHEESIEKALIRGGSRATQKHLERQRTKLRSKAEKESFGGIDSNDPHDDYSSRPKGMSGRAYTRFGAQMGARIHTIGRLGDAIDYLHARRLRRWDNR